MAQPSATQYVYWLEDLGKEDTPLVGKKSANLGEALRLGLRVPPGFAVSVRAYEDFLEGTRAGGRIREVIEQEGVDLEDIDKLDRLSARLREIVESEPFPAELEETIAGAYGELCRRCGRQSLAVSTRSAGPVSRPGQYETYLNVVGPQEVLEKIRRVWASTFNARSLAFRLRHGLPLERDPIGVTVLKMVNARAAGVLFTADPNSGDPETMVIEANWGLGESVVSGEVTPDVFYLDKKSLRVVGRKLGRKLHWVTTLDRGVAHQEVNAERQTSFCLNEAEAQEIARLGKKVEEHFQVPQDVEWAVDAESPFPENVVLLQTRPAVIAERKPAVDQVAEMLVKWFYA
ncbi:MAG: PEP/pyruvate-binding domain-containing protein [Moorellales bacterium]